jgi:hypothetical protein
MGFPVFRQAEHDAPATPDESPPLLRIELGSSTVDIASIAKNRPPAIHGRRMSAGSWTPSATTPGARRILADAGANHRCDPECDPEYTAQVTVAFVCVPYGFELCRAEPTR